MESTRLLRREDAAQYLNISTRHLDRLIRKGLIKAVKIGKSVRIFSGEIEKFLRDNVLVS